MYRRLLGEDHPTVAHTAALLAGVLRETGQLGEAETLLRAALEVHRTRFGEGHVRTISDRHQLALVLLETGRIENAEQEFDAALRNAARGDVPHALRGALELGRGALMLAQADYPEAEAAYRAAVGEFSADPEGADPAIALAYRGAGLAALLLDRPDQAVEDLTRAQNGYASAPMTDPNRILIAANLAQALAVAGQGEQALRVARETARAVAELPAGHRQRGLALLARARAELAANLTDAAGTSLSSLTGESPQPYATYAGAEQALLHAQWAVQIDDPDARREACRGLQQLEAGAALPPWLARERAEGLVACGA